VRFEDERKKLEARWPKKGGLTASERMGGYLLGMDSELHEDTLVLGQPSRRAVRVAMLSVLDLM